MLRVKWINCVHLCHGLIWVSVDWVYRVAVNELCVVDELCHTHAALINFHLGLRGQWMYYVCDINHYYCGI